MQKRLVAIREKFSIPSGRSILHIAVVEIVLQGIWEGATRLFGIEYFREIGFLVVFCLGIIAVAWYLPKLSPRWTGAYKPTHKEIETAPTSDPQERKRADWMTAALNRDTDNFPGCLIVHNMKINWLHLRETDSYFLIPYDVYSSSVFRLDIGREVDGHLYYESELMEKAIEILSPIEQLERGKTEHLVLRQWVSQSRMNRIAVDGGKEINLIFSDVDIWVKAKYPDNSEGVRFRLPIPAKLKVIIPTRPELENQ